MTTIFIGGDVLLPSGPTADLGVAVEDGVIIAIAPEETVMGHASDGDLVVDLAGGMIAPGFVDAHIHPIMGGLELNTCDLSGAESADEALDMIARYSAASPELEWITGGGWSMSWFEGGTPTAAALDAVVADRPVSLVNRDHHGTWVNSRALRIAGVTADTEDPSDGRIERDENGEPSGTLHEGASDLVDAHRTAIRFDEYYDALMTAQRHCLSLGITGWQDAAVHLRDGIDWLDVYREAVRRGDLKIRTTAALWFDRTRGEEQIDELLARRASLDVDRSVLDANTVKIMVDGVAENQTAAFTRPYRDACGHATQNHGLTFVGPEELKRVVQRLDEADMQVHFHVIGDRAASDALDAIEHAHTVNGPRDNRHHLAHVQVVSEADLGRFAQLRATATIQALWARDDAQITELTIPFLAEGFEDRIYPFGDLARSGVALAAGSDWPVSSADPLAAIQTAATRTEIGDTGARPFLPEQRLSPELAWAAYTAGSTRINHREQLTGSIRVGAAADLVVLDRNPFDGAHEDIASTRVVSTWIAGENVYSSASAPMPVPAATAAAHPNHPTTTQ